MNEMVWLDVVENDFWWTNYITGIKFEGTDGLEASFQIDKMKALTDTGTSCVYMPSVYYEPILQLIQ